VEWVPRTHYWPQTSFCECGVDHLNFLIVGENTGQLSYYHMLKKSSAPLT